ncbi:hypothetical protein GN956_G3622 [Arapaima gigas]
MSRARPKPHALLFQAVIKSWAQHPCAGAPGAAGAAGRGCFPGFGPLCSPLNFPHMKADARGDPPRAAWTHLSLPKGTVGEQLSHRVRSAWDGVKMLLRLRRPGRLEERRFRTALRRVRSPRALCG